MSKFNRLIAAAAIAGWVASPSAQAASYTFDINYLGHDQGSVATGSMSPVGMPLSEGDDFAYSLRAEPGMFWEVEAASNVFALFALAASETAVRSGDVVATLSLGGQTVLDYSAQDVQAAYIHLGSSYVNLNQGLKFDQLSFSYTLNSTQGCDYDPDLDVCTPNGSHATTLSSLMTVLGAPETNIFGTIAYTAAVPEPATVAEMTLGLAMLAALPAIGRRQRRARKN